MHWYHEVTGTFAALFATNACHLLISSCKYLVLGLIIAKVKSI